MKIGLLGSGDVAKALAAGFLARGDEVMIGTRTPEKLDPWVAEAGTGASAGSMADTASFGEIAVLATRGVAHAEVVEAAGREALDGKIVIDVTNPLVFAEDGPPQLAVGHDDSGGEQVQRALPGSKVVKAFNIIGNPHMVNPDFPDGPPTMFICGEDPDAKDTVMGILGDFGWEDIVDIGGIEGARLLEPLCVLWVRYGAVTGGWNHGFRVLRG